MTVRELIEELEKCNQDDIVVTHDSDEGDIEVTNLVAYRRGVITIQ
jgi:hypothetical protein